MAVRRPLTRPRPVENDHASGLAEEHDYRAAALAHEKDQRWQCIDLNLHFDEVVVEIEHGGNGKQAEFSAAKPVRQDRRASGPTILWLRAMWDGIHL
jgi:hypothetical protein